MGIHPHLTKSVKTFTKIVGGVTSESTKVAMEEFDSLDIETVAYNNSSESELAKLLSTTYYGMCIEFMQNAHQLCENFDLSFDNVYTKTNNIYNQGYKELGKSNVIRPILKYVGEGIGGHCITSNAKILVKQFPHYKIAKDIVDIGKPEDYEKSR
jgi:UDP-N-acetyl-D-mannosaminuronate dehydrogenase